MPTPKKCETPPKEADEPERHVMVAGIDEPVGLRYWGQPCPACDKATTHGGVFLNHERQGIEYWRCKACFGYGFAPYPGLRIDAPARGGTGVETG